METRLISTQRAILFQSQEVALTRALTDVRSNVISLRVNHLLETDETKKKDIGLLLMSLENEEKRLKVELAKTNHEFLSVIQGPSVDQLLSGTVSPPSDPANENERERIKRRRLNDKAAPRETDDAHSRLPQAQMLVDNNVDTRLQSEEVRTCHLSPSNNLTAAKDDTPDIPMKPVIRPLPHPRSAYTFRGVFDKLRNLNVHNHSRTVYHRSRSNSCFLLLGLLLAISLLQTAQASTLPPATSTLSIYALNANGLVQPVKLSHINSVIKARNPQTFVLGETKTKSKLSSSLPFHDYDIYEESGEQDQPHHPVKWGIIVGVRKSIQIARRLDIKHRSLKGRVIALDLILPSSDGRCHMHRFIGAYAPWNPGDNGVSCSFWTDLTDLCRSTKPLGHWLVTSMPLSHRLKGRQAVFLHARNSFTSLPTLMPTICG